jgi:cytochrome c-type biogenesis protein
MAEWLAALTHAVQGAPHLALGASFAWGVLSILLSPCHLSSVPLIVGFVGEQSNLTTRRAFTISTAFAVGILVTIALIGAVTAALGRMMGDVGRYGNYLLAGIFFLVGLHLIGVIPAPWSGPGQVGTKQRGLLAGFILGLLFGVALGPCTFAYMAPMLGVTLQVATTNLLYAGALLLAFGVGHCSVIVAAGTSTEAVQRYLHWTDRSRGADILRKVCGVLVLLGGLYLIYTAH